MLDLGSCQIADLALGAFAQPRKIRVVPEGDQRTLAIGCIGMGRVQGAAIASLGVNIASFVVLGVYVHRSAPEHAIFQRFWRPDPEALGRVFRLGWPIGLTNLAEVGLFASASVMMGWLGTLPLAQAGVLAAITVHQHRQSPRETLVEPKAVESPTDPAAIAF